MNARTNVTAITSLPALRALARSRVSIRDLLPGALVVAAWIALWTMTWAALAGAIAP